jgi:hypothetical protein
MSKTTYGTPTTPKHILSLITKAQALNIPEKAKAFIVNHIIQCGQGKQISENEESPTGWPHNIWHKGLLCTGMGWDEHYYIFGKLMNDVYLRPYKTYDAWSDNHYNHSDVYFEANDSAIKIWEQFFTE